MVGNNLKRIRKEMNLTQEQLAQKINMSRSYLGDVENNRNNPSIKTVKLLSDKLEVDIIELISDDNS